VRIHFRSAAVKVMALLTLLAVWTTSVSPLLAAAVLCRAAG
jgi:hypothetical protein